MAAEVSLQFDSRQWDSFIKRVSNRLSKIEKGDKIFTSIISARVIKDIDEHFQKEQGPKSAWEEWSVKYAQFMNKIGKGGNKILQDTGNLRQHIKPTDYRKGRGSITWFNNAKTKNGFAYAEYHNKTREFMWLSTRGLMLIKKDTLKFLKG